jgi:hypothetical protein
MQAQHGAAVVGILPADIEDGATGGNVNGWQQYGPATGLTSPLYHGVAVCGKLLAVQMAMGVDIHIWDEV